MKKKEREKEELISVIIATRNRSEVLLRSLYALDAQSEEGWPFEVIVVDDGSTDGTGSLVKSASVNFPLSCFSRPPGGPAAARNAGLERAKGRVVLFLNDDCLADGELLARHRERLREYGGECAVLGRIEWAPEVECSALLRELVGKYYFPFYQIEGQEEVSFAYFITGNLSAPLEKIKEAGGFDEDFREAAFEDVELGYRMYQLGVPLKYNPSALAHHAHSLDFDDLFERQRKIAYWLNVFLAKHPEAAKFYPGINTSSLPELPAGNRSCLEMILRYASYRGLKEGRVELLDREG